MVVSDLTRGREAYSRQDWSEAVAALTGAAADGDLDPADLEALAVAAHLSGHVEESQTAWEQAHHAWREVGDPARAARCAAILGIELMLHGEVARATGWFGRGRRLLADTGEGCAAAGYLLVPEAIEHLADGRVAACRSTYEQVVSIAQRCGDADLLALGLMGCGEAAVAGGDTRAGLGLLDEAMVSVTTGEVSPLMAGLLYCAVLEVCLQVHDLRRGAEWTDAFTRWCDTTDAVPYRGPCLVHRSQILQAHGRWADALAEATRAERWLARFDDPGVGLALYQLGELHRLRGELDAADTAYRQAIRFGHEPAPGLALLRLAEGQVDAALSAIGRMVDEAVDVPARLAVLPVAVEIALAAGDLDTARTASDDLDALAAEPGPPYLEAVAAHARGAVQLAIGDAVGALGTLRRAAHHWRDLAMPYERARTEELVGEACGQLGDHEGADNARDAARQTFEGLDAVVDLERVDRVRQDRARSDHGRWSTATGHQSLTEREAEVLRLVAEGRTNREIGETLVISEHTAARHVQNIFTKLGVSSRAAATAHAYRHHLL